jgi:SprT-like family
MTLRNKVLLVIFLAIVYFWMFQRQDDAQDKSDGCATSVPRERLQKWYFDANRDYFDNKLSPDTEIVWANLRFKEAMGDTDCNPQGCKIRIDPYVNIAPATAQLTEYHEMCHVATQGVDFMHGPEFQKCIQMLYDKGALKGLI